MAEEGLLREQILNALREECDLDEEALGVIVNRMVFDWTSMTAEQKRASNVHEFVRAAWLPHWMQANLVANRPQKSLGRSVP